MRVIRIRFIRIIMRVTSKVYKDDYEGYYKGDWGLGV